MSYPLTFKFLANYEERNFKQTFLSDSINESQLKNFEKYFKRYIASTLYKDFMSYVFDNTALVFSIIFTVISDDQTFVEDYWKSILVNDLKIDPDASVNGENCVKTLLNIILNSTWNKATMYNVINKINEYKQNGVYVETEKLELFYMLFEKEIDPLHFPYAHLKDFLETLLTLNSHIRQTALYQFIPFVDEQVQKLDFDVPSDWINFISSLVNDKFRTNLFDDKQLEMYLFVKSAFLNISSFLSDLKEIDPCISTSLLLTLRDFTNYCITHQSQSILDLIESYDFKNVLQTYINECKWTPAKLHILDTSKLDVYQKEILENSTNDSHIHFALYPIWKLITQHFLNKRDPGVLYGALESIHKFSTIDYDLQNLIQEEDSYSKVYNIESVINKLKFWLKETYNESLKLKDAYQSKDWFFNFYTYINNLVLSVIYDVCKVLTSPLYAQLKEYDNFISEYIQGNLDAVVYMYFKNKIESQLFKVIEKCLQLRNDTDLNIKNLGDGNVSSITTKLIELVDTFINNLPSLYDLGSSENAKVKIKNTILKDISQDKLRFDIISEQLYYFKHFDTFYNQFLNAFRNKLKFTLNKFIQQIEHNFVISFYTHLVDFDSITYFIYFPSYTLSTYLMLLKRCIYPILFDSELIDRALSLTSFGVSLITPKIFIDSIKLKDLDHIRDIM